MRQGYMITTIQGTGVFECKKTGIKGYTDTRIKIYEDARIQGFLKEGIKRPNARIQ